MRTSLGIGRIRHVSPSLSFSPSSSLGVEVVALSLILSYSPFASFTVLVVFVRRAWSVYRSLPELKGPRARSFYDFVRLYICVSALVLGFALNYHLRKREKETRKGHREEDTESNVSREC